MSRSTPVFSELDRAACEACLARNHLGRLAFAWQNRVDIEPLHYAFVEGHLYGRTSPGSKVAAIQHSHWVAFEVDEVSGLFDWRSVVVHGGWYTRDSAPPAEEAAWAKGVAALETLVSGALTPDDPAPLRTIVFRVHLGDVTGRECHTTG
jgi:nitroimidazol reductase NimA-like FMN-containing flavoprotein (pyridoxamine 5'-phosphate oxidase superfamily)